MINKYWFLCILSLLFLGTLYLNSTEKAPLLLPLEFERIIDGDTFVASEKIIRLWGVDAPEKDDPLGFSATLFLENLLSKGELNCSFIELDRYQRNVMRCTIDGLDIGSMMVQAGLAEDYATFSDGYYMYEEQIAKAKKIGIWKVIDDTPI